MKYVKKIRAKKVKNANEVGENSIWLITSELDKQRARKVLFTCVV